MNVPKRLGHLSKRLPVLVLATLIATSSLLVLPLNMGLSAPSQAASSVQENTLTGSVNETQSNTPEEPIDMEEPLAFDAAVLEESVYLANRGGDMAALGVSEAVEEMKKQAESTVPVFTETDQPVYVSSQLAIAYKKPIDNTFQAGSYRYGTKLYAVATSDNWVRVQNDEGFVYLHTEDVSNDMIFLPVGEEGETRYVQETDKEFLKLRSEPTEDAESIKDIWFADRVTELERSADWSLIRTESGHEGYIPCYILSEGIVFVMDSTNVYATGELAVYAEPNEDSEKIHYYDKNDKMFRNGYSFDWCRVITSEDEIGYVRMNQLTTANPFYRAPTTTYRPPAVTVAPQQYSNAAIQTVINKAMSYVGCPYRLGGLSYAGIDCSGLTYRAFESVGIYLPRLSYSYWSVGRAVSFSELRPGDVVCYDSEWNGSIGHVAIYIGNGQVVHAQNPWKGVAVGSVYFGNYRIMTVRRLIG